MGELFDDEHGGHYRPPPMLRPPAQPTRDEYERHRTTRATFAMAYKLFSCTSGRTPTPIHRA